MSRKLPSIPTRTDSGTARKPHEICLTSKKIGETREQVLSNVAVDGVVAAACTTRIFANATVGEIDLMQACDELRSQIEATKNGDMSIADRLLVSQAITLNVIFHDCCRRGQLNMGEYPEAAERYMRLGLKAQSQCRATLESLAAIKNPPVVFAKQANIAHGHQQINNSACTTGPRAETETLQTELLEITDGEWMDKRTTRAAGSGNPSLEAVGTIDRPKNRKRKGLLKL